MTTKKGKGRPTSLTPEVQTVIIACLKKGAYAETAIAYAGIGKETYYRWLRQAEHEKPGEPHRDFWDSIARAKAEGELQDLMVIDAAANRGLWQAAAWRLERKFPKRWGRRVDLGEGTAQTLTDWLARVLTDKEGPHA